MFWRCSRFFHFFRKNICTFFVLSEAFGDKTFPLIFPIKNTLFHHMKFVVMKGRGYLHIVEFSRSFLVLDLCRIIVQSCTFLIDFKCLNFVRPVHGKLVLSTTIQPSERSKRKMKSKVIMEVSIFSLNSSRTANLEQVSATLP